MVQQTPKVRRPLDLEQMVKVDLATARTERPDGHRAARPRRSCCPRRTGGRGVGQARRRARRPVPTPGELLLEEFLKPPGISQHRLAKEIGVPQRRIGELVAGKRAVTADTGLRLSKFFGTSEGFWVGLQLDHDAAVAREALADTLAKIRPWRSEQAGAA